MGCSTPGSLSITNSWSLLKLMSIESVMPSNHLTLCHPLLLPSIFPNIKGFSNESVLRIRWPKYWSFSFSMSPSNEYSGLTSFRIDWLDLLAFQGTLKSLLQQHSAQPSLWSNSHDYWKNYSFDFMDLCWQNQHPGRPVTVPQFHLALWCIYSQFSSVTQLCPTLCDPMNHSTPGLSVHHQLPEFSQTHVHQVCDAIQPSHPLSSPSPPAPNPSQHQGLFQCINSYSQSPPKWISKMLKPNHPTLKICAAICKWCDDRQKNSCEYKH